MNESIYSGTRCDAISEIISSVAKEQSGLASILSVEAEKIKYVTSKAESTQDILDTNKSVEKMINAITKLEVILASKLELFNECLCENCYEKQGYSILSLTVESENGGRVERDDDLKVFRYYPGTTGTTIKFITEPETLVTYKSGMPVGLKYDSNKLYIPDSYNWGQTHSMIFTVGEGATAYDIVLMNMI